MIGGRGEERDRLRSMSCESECANLFRMTKADFLAEQARQEERRRISMERGVLISSQSGGGKDEGCREQGLIGGTEKPC